ncbi:phage tail assembly protein [Paracidovorax avenae]|uniref:phage tail assembly protein n=1 Tax=Paracidovorax avenae TaxID=80867 RepID=UPI000D20C4DE|nr:phage tail assembly protein [Paracidovorax avenae]AVS66634.1 phage tail assembly protein [Paracidovorax avenae]
MNDTTATEVAAAVAAPAQATDTVTLETPIVRGTQKITTLTLRKPSAGELRGISLAGLLNVQAEAVLALLPRITSPTIHAQEAAKLDPADLVEMGGVIVDFLLKKERKAEFLPA